MYFSIQIVPETTSDWIYILQDNLRTYKNTDFFLLQLDSTVKISKDFYLKENKKNYLKARQNIHELRDCKVFLKILDLFVAICFLYKMVVSNV